MALLQTTAKQILPDQIMVYGQRYPISGWVTRKSISPMPPKTVTGDYRRSDKVGVSEWILSDFTGGLGILDSRGPQDADRYHIGTLEARFQDLTLGPLPVLANRVSLDGTTASGTLTQPSKMAEYAGSLWCVKDTDVYIWDNALGWWRRRGSEADDFIDGTPTDLMVHDGALYLLTTSDLYQYQPATLTWSRHDTVPAAPGYALLGFDDKLYRLDTQNKMWWSLPAAPSTGIGALTWTYGGELLQPPGACRQMLVFFDQTGEQAIHAITKTGVMGYDADSAKFFATPVMHPPVPNAGTGACVWQGALYIPVGSSIWKYTGSLVSVVGPDKDDGLPADQQGDISQVLGSHTFLYALATGRVIDDRVDALGGEPYDTFGGTLADPPYPTPPAPIPPATPPISVSQVWPYQFQLGFNATGSLLVSPGASWHQLPYYQAEDAPGDPLAYAEMGAAIIAAADGFYRLWYSDSSGVYFQDLSTGMHNPLHNPATRYARHGYLRTIYWDADWVEIDKLLVSLDVEVQTATVEETIEIAILIDGKPLPEGPFLITQAGSHSWSLGGNKGRRFRLIQAQITMRRGSNVSSTPRLHSIALGFFRLPRYIRAWEAQLDLTEPRCREGIGIPAGELAEKIFDALESGETGLFTYRYAHLDPLTRRVKLSEVVGSDAVGEAGGRYRILLMETDI